MKNEESVLSWLTHQVESDEIEDVTDEMLDMLIEKSPSLAAFFCKFLTTFSIHFQTVLTWKNAYTYPIVDVTDDKTKAEHLAVLKELENIDDECDSNEIAFVKISNLDEAKEYGLDILPALVYFENRIPSIYEGILSNHNNYHPLFPTKHFAIKMFRLIPANLLNKYNLCLENIKGNLSEEEQVLAWLVEQKNSDTIEELTDELLENIVKTNEYVVVYFS